MSSRRSELQLNIYQISFPRTIKVKCSLAISGTSWAFKTGLLILFSCGETKLKNRFCLYKFQLTRTHKSVPYKSFSQGRPLNIRIDCLPMLWKYWQSLVFLFLLERGRLEYKKPTRCRLYWRIMMDAKDVFELPSINQTNAFFCGRKCHHGITEFTWCQILANTLSTASVLQLVSSGGSCLYRLKNIPVHIRIWGGWVERVALLFPPHSSHIHYPN